MLFRIVSNDTTSSRIYNLSPRIYLPLCTGRSLLLITTWYNNFWNQFCVPIFFQNIKERNSICFKWAILIEFRHSPVRTWIILLNVNHFINSFKFWLKISLKLNSSLLNLFVNFSLQTEIEVWANFGLESA